MAQNSAGGEDDKIDWNTDDDLEIDNYQPSPSSPAHFEEGKAAGSAEASSSSGSPSTNKIDYLVGMGFSEEMIARAIDENGGEGDVHSILDTLINHSASSMAGSSKSKVIDHFLGMGFPEAMVIKAIQENGEEDTDSILMTLLAYSAIENSPQEQQNCGDNCSSDFEGSFYEEYSDRFSDGEEMTNFSPEEDNRLKFLVKMGYTGDEALIAIERCGPNATIAELTDFICAAQMAKETDALLGEPIEEKPRIGVKKRGTVDYENLKRKKLRGFQNGDEEPLRLPNPMIGFGVPSEPGLILHRSIPEAARGPPYFYYENVALAPRGVWDTISRFLYDVEPEFVDSKYFCAAARKRGYIHNLPIDNRYPLLPLPPRTIHEALPLTKRWWPSWDTRTKLNCLQTCIASAKLTERVRKSLEDHDGEPPLTVQKYVMDQCRKWNLVWVGRNKAAPLEPDELEMLLGFPRNHTRGGGISRTDRYKSLGNSFQVDTVAYHLSSLKDIFPRGLNLLSLFSGIGGAEVALYRLGIPLKTVVSVEISEVNRGIMRSWWEQTNQKGVLVDIADVQDLDSDRIEQLMDRFGGFDLVVGGSPCNNLAGSNRVSRNGLEGKESSLFFDYFRILEVVKTKMSKIRR